jgi:carbamoyl-phosphate synthase large subunit
MADITYIEPLNIQCMIEIIENERARRDPAESRRPDGPKPDSKLLRGNPGEIRVKVIGVQVDAIEQGRGSAWHFMETMIRLG